MTAPAKIRCAWAETNELFIPYHDKEWGVPLHDDRALFEMLNLEGAQAGLSWLTILKKRQNYRQAFDNFDAKKIAVYDEIKRSELLGNAGIIRNRLKINAVIENAKAFLKIQEEFGSFDAYIWLFVNNQPVIPGKGQDAAGISRSMAKDLRKRGFRFMGETTTYAFMQSVGMINDHSRDCFRFKLV